MTPEGRVKAKVSRALKALGPSCWRFMPVQSGYGSPALDYLISYKSRFIAIETKAPGKKLTPLQESTKAAIEAAGGLVFVVWDESSLAIVLKIILALEFADAPSTAAHLAACLQLGRGDYSGKIEARRFAKAKGFDPEHMRAGHASNALDAAASGHHGAPGKEPE